MSIKVLQKVWDNSKSSGSELLLLLALADAANDEGICWPSLNTLAKKSRLTRRYVIYLINDLVESGQIKRVGQAGQEYKKSTVYRITCEPTVTSEPCFTSPLVNPVSPSEPRFTKLVNPVSPNPSLTRQLREEEDDSKKRPNIYNLYEQTIGPLYPKMADILADAEKRYAQQWLEAAFEETAKNNGHSWSYTQKILHDWERNGFRADTRKKGQPWKRPVKEETYSEEHS